MNFYNPYMNINPTSMGISNSGLFRRLAGVKGGFNWSSLLSGTQKFLGIANQAIPMVKQISPVVRNAKTMFKVMNEFKKVDTPNTNNNNSTINNDNNSSKENSIERTTNNSYQESNPVFFI